MGLLLICWLIGTPVLDAVAGIQVNEEGGGSLLAQSLRGGWTIVGVLYLLSRRHRYSIAVAVPLAAFGTSLLAAGFVNDAPAAGLVSAVRLWYVATTIGVVCQLTAIRVAYIRYVPLAACGGMILTAGAVLAAGIGGMGVSNVYAVEGVAVAGTWYSAQSVPAFTLLMYSALSAVGSRIKRKIVLALIVGGVTILTSVRAALLAFVVSSLCNAYLDRAVASRGLRLRAIMVSILTAVVVIAIASVCVPEVLNRWQDSSGAGRADFQRIALEDIWSRTAPDLLLGLGPQRIARVLASRFGAQIGAHNDFLDIASAWGLAGLFLWCCAMGGLLTGVGRAVRQAVPGAAEAAAAFCILGVFSLLHGSLSYMGANFVFATLIGMVNGNAFLFARSELHAETDRR